MAEARPEVSEKEGYQAVAGPREALPANLDLTESLFGIYNLTHKALGSDRTIQRLCHQPAEAGDGPAQNIN